MASRLFPPGFTLGLVGAMLFMGVMLVLGKKVLAPLALRGLPADEVARRLGKFQSTMLGRTLLILFLVYPVRGGATACAQALTCLAGRFRGNLQHLLLQVHLACLLPRG